MRRLLPRPCSPRRGVTLVEMLVVLALLVLMMTIIVQVFQAATGTISAAKTYQELDGRLRMVDVTIRQDLGGVTSRFTPPNDPNSNNGRGAGYFEYGENEFADVQGEDSDDYLKFTAKAPDGQPFTGRIWTGPAKVTNVPLGGQFPPVYQPVVVTSPYAEIIYFLRNGNLYRRVLLVAPERQNTIAPSATYYSAMFGASNTINQNIATSWQGMNDLSAHPSVTANSINPIILNSLGSLTNRENRYASPRFSSDYWNTTLNAAGSDGLPDDLNGDGINDLYPSLYPYLAATGYNTGLLNDWDPSGLSGYTPPSRFPFSGKGTQPDYFLFAFPYVFPNMYSKPDPNSVANGQGWIHSIDPDTAKSQTYLNSLLTLNHSPLDLGDSLLPPQNGNDTQTWWGFPTWRETLSPNWTDPYLRPNVASLAGIAAQSTGLQPWLPNSPPIPSQFPMLPMAAGTYAGVYFPGPLIPQPYTEASSPFGAAAGGLKFYTAPSGLPVWPLAWEDDLILTGVRSFDVKALDQTYGGYVDLGWGDDLRLYTPYGGQTTPPFLAGTPLYGVTQSNAPATSINYTTNPYQWPPGTGLPQVSLPPPNTVVPGDFVIQATFAHEGRMPPLISDNRYNPNYPPTPANPNVPTLGDASNSVIRLRRVWDSWSTDYQSAPSTGYNPMTNFSTGPPLTPPIYPSFPAPYPAPLRGIQIQIRVVDPRNERVKVLTIRQDFSNNL